jgi:hypothetical protein
MSTEDEIIEDARKVVIRAIRIRYLAGLEKTYTRKEAREMIIKSIKPNEE